MNTISQRAAPQQAKRLPKYHAMAKVDGGWVRIGAAWEVRSGEDALSVQLTSFPVNWDGRFSLFLPTVQNLPDPGPQLDHAGDFVHSVPKLDTKKK